MRFLEESKHHHLPRIKTVQNPYSLLNRLLKAVLPKFVLEKMSISLLQWLLDLIRKFLTGEKHPNARINLFPQFARYNSAQCAEATKLYQEIA
jgi:aryl-alcohol dehydrogenase-like predicted oxidoreductase